MSPDDRWRLHHMIEAAEQALAFVAGRERSALDSDDMLRLALTRAVEIVGDAASQVSGEGRADLADVPWAQVHAGEVSAHAWRVAPDGLCDSLPVGKGRP